MDIFLMTAALDRLLHPLTSTFDPADARHLYQNLPDHPRISFTFTFLTPRRRKTLGGGDVEPVRIGRYLALRSGNQIEVWLPEDENSRWVILYGHDGNPLSISVYDPKKPVFDLFVVRITLGLDRWIEWKKPEDAGKEAT